VKFQLDNGGGNYRITAYDRYTVTINNQALDRGLIVTAGQLVRDWGPDDAEALTAEHMRQILPLRPDIILLGTGAATVFPEHPVLLPVYEAGIGLEVMDTAAACRSYNILISEGRDVAAALLMIGD